MSYDETITIRTTEANDARALLHLAALDSADPIAGPALVAEVNGTMRAALSLDGGRAIGDPFAESAHFIELLEAHARALAAVAHAAQLDGHGRPRLALAA
jgi:hypothetical protein